MTLQLRLKIAATVVLALPLVGYLAWYQYEKIVELRSFKSRALICNLDSFTFELRDHHLETGKFPTEAEFNKFVRKNVPTNDCFMNPGAMDKSETKEAAIDPFGDPYCYVNGGENVVYVYSTNFKYKGDFFALEVTPKTKQDFLVPGDLACNYTFGHGTYSLDDITQEFGGLVSARKNSIPGSEGNVITVKIDDSPLFKSQIHDAITLASKVAHMFFKNNQKLFPNVSRVDVDVAFNGISKFSSPFRYEWQELKKSE